MTRVPGRPGVALDGEPEPRDPMIAETSFGDLAMCCNAAGGAHDPQCLRRMLLAAWQPEPGDGKAEG